MIGTKNRSAAREPEHLAVRLNDLDLARACEQTAILMALLSAFGEPPGAAEAELDSTGGGTRSRRGQKVRAIDRRRGAYYALAPLLGYLGHSYCRGRVLVAPRTYLGTGRSPLARLWKQLAEGRIGDEAVPDPSRSHPSTVFGLGPAGRSEWELDFVVSPLDGLRSLLAGMNEGCVSVLAAGPRGSLVAPDLSEDSPQRSDDFLVLATQRGFLRSTDPRYLWRLAARASSRSDDEVLALAHSLVRGSIEASGTRIPNVATAVNERDYCHRKLRPMLQSVAKTRTLAGSSVAAAMSVFFPHLGLSAFVGVMQRTHVLQLAVAARATGGQILAIPVRREREQAETEVVSLRCGRIGLTTDELLPKAEGTDDIFLVASGVTENILLEGVRFRDAHRVTTKSLCLRSWTQSSRTISHHHHLERKVFRFLSLDAPRSGGKASRPRLSILLDHLESRGVRLRTRFLRER